MCLVTFWAGNQEEEIRVLVGGRLATAEDHYGFPLWSSAVRGSCDAGEC
jgi:hypothetical protein